MIPSKQYTTMDKSTWGDGPWQSEFDKAQWADAATGYACLIVRSPVTGSLCGYVGVPEGHPAYRKHYDDVNVDVHGGLTFSDHCREATFETWKDRRAKRRVVKKQAQGYPLGDSQRWLDDHRETLENFPLWLEQQEATHVCHVGDKQKVWWLGFDCSHAGDFSPAMEARMHEIDMLVPSPMRLKRPYCLLDEIYRDAAYVADQIMELAQQLKAMEGGPALPSTHDPRHMGRKLRMKQLRKMKAQLEEMKKHTEKTPP